ncbi:MAG: hypothetical protein ABSD20_09230 [Terriglobales bacterium]|jgi:hypothetical protein
MPENHNVTLLLAIIYGFWALVCRWVVSHPAQILYRLDYFDRTARPGRRALRRTSIIAFFGHAVFVYLALGPIFEMGLPPRWAAFANSIPLTLLATALVLCITLQGTRRMFRDEGHGM